MNEHLDDMIDDVAAEMKELRRRIHQNPEPAYEEVGTSAAIVEKLEQIPGIEIDQGLGKTGIQAILGGEKQGPCIALRADMDCLKMTEENSFMHASKKKGLMHACGHDGHIACLVGSALLLGRMQTDLHGPVKFIFQPAEENQAGAQAMIKDGVLENPRPRAIFALHGTTSLAFGKVGICPGSAMATSKYFLIRVKGWGTHAAMPHKGVDPVLVASHIVCAAQSIISRNMNPMEAALISIPKFMGGSAPNVIPMEVQLEGTLRALSNDTQQRLETRLEEVVRYTAQAFGATAEIEFYGGYPLLENDGQCVEYVKTVACGVLGHENVDSLYPPSLGAEDFSYYLEHIPGAFFWIGLQDTKRDYVPLHNPRFDFNDEAIALGIRLHCQLALNAERLSVGHYN